jgi:hypothetical protein
MLDLHSYDSLLTRSLAASYSSLRCWLAIPRPAALAHQVTSGASWCISGTVRRVQTTGLPVVMGCKEIVSSHA